ncbi:MAG: hypothetical protein C0504_12360 [Candidatus Solibacter sp.]|nr:hypothetical protein [Candidatus Solibacter sp.]
MPTMGTKREEQFNSKQERSPMGASNSKSQFAEYGSIVSLLHNWEALNHEALVAARNLQGDEPAVRALLDEVSEMIDTGDWHVSGLNIFEVLGRVRLENAHSDMIAWLFMPWEAHGLGDRFLREFVFAGTGEAIPNGRVRKVATRRRIGAGAGEIDIEVQGDGWLLAVENKIDASEGPRQTEGYAAHYRRLRDAGTTVYCLFLTRTGEPAKSDLFRSISYRELRRLVERIQPQVSSEGGQVVNWFAEHIRDDLEKSTSGDKSMSTKDMPASLKLVFVRLHAVRELNRYLQKGGVELELSRYLKHDFRSAIEERVPDLKEWRFEPGKTTGGWYPDSWQLGADLHVSVEVILPSPVDEDDPNPSVNIKVPTKWVGYPSFSDRSTPCVKALLGKRFELAADNEGWSEDWPVAKYIPWLELDDSFNASGLADRIALEVATVVRLEREIADAIIAASTKPHPKAPRSLGKAKAVKPRRSPAKNI